MRLARRASAYAPYVKRIVLYIHIQYSGPVVDVNVRHYRHQVCNIKHNKLVSRGLPSPIKLGQVDSLVLKEVIVVREFYLASLAGTKPEEITVANARIASFRRHEQTG